MHALKIPTQMPNAVPASAPVARPLRLLFVCGRNRLRSPTAEEIFAAPGIETASAGVSPDADTPLDADLIAWADVIFFMEAAHRSKAAWRFSAALRGKRVVCLRIPDQYEYMQPALIELLKSRVGTAVPQVRQE